MSNYIRKTKDEYSIEGYYCGSWETVVYAEDYKDAKRLLKDYDDNEKEPHRIACHRVKINS